MQCVWHFGQVTITPTMRKNTKKAEMVSSLFFSLIVSP
ncbi:hypothetical protein URS_0048 [Acinetobacter ursingii]|nr:hypothetical protein URS_0048 [Acinetobacter ursingii]